MQLTNLDFILILIYFAVLIFIGYWSSRKQNDEDYLIADRKLGAWQTMFTINASKTGAILMIFTSLVYLFGFAAIWYFIGMVVGMLLFLPFALRLKEHSKGKFYTLADYFKTHYSKKVAFIVSLITIFLMFGFLVINLIAGAKIFVYFSGWPFWMCALVMMIVVLIYILMGGFKAVVKTDILQYVAMLFILVLLVLILFKGSVIPPTEWNLFNIDKLSLIGFFLAGILFPFAMPDLWQRVYSSKDKKALKRGIIGSTIVYAIFAFILSLISLTVKVNFPGVDPDLALIYGFGNMLPTGLLGLAVVLLFAAIMSTIDTSIFTASSAIIQDFFKWDKRKTVKNIKKTIFILAILGTLTTIIIQDLIIGTFIFIAVLVILSIIVFTTWIKIRTKSTTLFFGLLFGLLAFFYFIITGLITKNLQPTIAVYSILATIIGLGIGAIISYFKYKN